MPSPPTPKTFLSESLQVRVYPRQADLAADAAQQVQHYLQQVLEIQGHAHVILASAASQVQFLDALTALSGLNWSAITVFHMDEYLGITDAHPASFRRFLRERVQERVHPRAVQYLQGEALEPLQECERYGGLLRAQPIDLCCLGIGENGHIAFNDPAVANFDDPWTVKLVKLDELCRRQQVGEGAFPTMAAVPEYAYTLTIPALCGARKLICVVPEKRKAAAVKAALQGPLSAACPSSILRRQAHATLFLDSDSASLL